MVQHFSISCQAEILPGTFTLQHTQQAVFINCGIESDENYAAMNNSGIFYFLKAHTM